MKRLFAALVLLLLAAGYASGASVKWTSKVSQNYISTSLATDGQMLFITASDGVVTALDKSNGRLGWRTPLSNKISSSPTYENGRLYVAAADGTIYSLDSATGVQMWSYNTAESVWGSSPVFYKNMLFVGTEKGNIYAINSTDGRMMWKFETGGPIRSTPLVFSGRLYVGSEDSSVYCIEASTGGIVWEYETGGPIWTSSPSVYSNIIYIGSMDGRVYSLNATNGRPFRTFKTDGWVASNPVAREGIVYFGSNDKHFYSVDAITMKLRWKFETGASVQSTPEISTSRRGTVIYFGSNDGSIYSLRANTGIQVWNYSVGDWVASKPLVEGDTVYFTSYDGNVYCVSGLSCSITFPPENQKVSDEYLEVSGTATAVEGVGKVYVRLEGGSWNPAKGGEQWSANVSLNKLQYGEFDIECKATDSLSKEEVPPFSKVKYVKTEYVPSKEMYLEYPQEVTEGQQITITVTDEAGAPLEGAAVTVQSFEYVSDANGVVELPPSPQGKINAEVSKQGYIKKSIQITVKQDITFYIYLLVLFAVFAVIAVILRLRRRRR